MRLKTGNCGGSYGDGGGVSGAIGDGGSDMKVLMMMTGGDTSGGGDGITGGGFGDGEDNCEGVDRDGGDGDGVLIQNSFDYADSRQI